MLVNASLVARKRLEVESWQALHIQSCISISVHLLIRSVSCPNRTTELMMIC